MAKVGGGLTRRGHYASPRRGNQRPTVAVCEGKAMIGAIRHLLSSLNQNVPQKCFGKREICFHRPRASHGRIHCNAETERSTVNEPLSNNLNLKYGNRYVSLNMGRYFV